MENDKKVSDGKNKNILLLFAAIAIVLIVVSGYKFKGVEIFGFLNKDKVLTQDEAKAKALDFISKNMVQPGTEVDISGISEEAGMYKLDIDVSGQKIVAYLTKDGKKFFPNVIDIEEAEKKVADSQQEVVEENKEVPKAEKPVIDLYVMSFCPFGNKAEDTLKPAYELLKSKADFNFHYIVNSAGEGIQSLHGEKEVVQNEREVCVLKNYGADKWFSFVTYVNTNCGSDGACWEAGAKTMGVDTAKISSCAASEGLALMKEEEKASTAAGADGSPTMVINGVETKAVYQYGNSEGYKQAICGAFNEVPAECSTVLSSSTSTAAGGSCE